jgi:hypothetical protein
VLAAHQIFPNGDVHCGSKPVRWLSRVIFTKERMRNDIPEEPVHRGRTRMHPSASTDSLKNMDASSPARKAHAQK